MEISKQKLLDNFNELLSIEQKARDYYNDLLKLKIPAGDRRAITHIRDDEERHIKIAQKIVKIIETDRMAK